MKNLDTGLSLKEDYVYRISSLIVVRITPIVHHTPNKSLSRNETDIDITHLAMGGGVKKVFDMLRGVQKFCGLRRVGQKSWTPKIFNCPAHPHQSISEHSLNWK